MELPEAPLAGPLKRSDAMRGHHLHADAAANAPPTGISRPRYASSETDDDPSEAAGESEKSNEALLKPKASAESGVLRPELKQVGDFLDQPVNATVTGTDDDVEDYDDVKDDSNHNSNCNDNNSNSNNNHNNNHLNEYSSGNGLHHPPLAGDPCEQVGDRTHHERRRTDALPGVRCHGDVLSRLHVKVDQFMFSYISGFLKVLQKHGYASREGLRGLLLQLNTGRRHDSHWPPSSKTSSSSSASPSSSASSSSSSSADDDDEDCASVCSSEPGRRHI